MKKLWGNGNIIILILKRYFFRGGGVQGAKDTFWDWVLTILTYWGINILMTIGSG